MENCMSDKEVAEVATELFQQHKDTSEFESFENTLRNEPQKISRYLHVIHHTFMQRCAMMGQIRKFNSIPDDVEKLRQKLLEIIDESKAVSSTNQA